MARPPGPTIPIPAADLRAKFNRRSFAEALRRGTVVAVALSRTPADPLYNQPDGTVSIIESYRDARTGDELARVHFYLCPGGRIGGSGRPDPKLLVEDGVVYILKRS